MSQLSINRKFGDYVSLGRYGKYEWRELGGRKKERPLAMYTWAKLPLEILLILHEAIGLGNILQLL